MQVAERLQYLIIISTTHLIPIGALPIALNQQVYFRRKKNLNGQEQLHVVITGDSDDSRFNLCLVKLGVATY